MLRWFPRLQAATACFSCSPPDLNILDPYFIFMYMHYNHCHQVTAHLQLNILLLLLILLLLVYFLTAIGLTPGGCRRPLRKPDSLTTFTCRISWKSGSLNLLDPSRSHRAGYGTALPLMSSITSGHIYWCRMYCFPMFYFTCLSTYR